MTNLSPQQKYILRVYFSLRCVKFSLWWSLHIMSKNLCSIVLTSFFRSYLNVVSVLLSWWLEWLILPNIIIGDHQYIIAYLREGWTNRKPWRFFDLKYRLLFLLPKCCQTCCKFPAFSNFYYKVISLFRDFKPYWVSYEGCILAVITVSFNTVNMSAHASKGRFLC